MNSVGSAMATVYCVPCQETHKMTQSCLQEVDCKNCGASGHLRLDCPGLELGEKFNWPSTSLKQGKEDPVPLIVRLKLGDKGGALKNKKRKRKQTPSKKRKRNQTPSDSSKKSLKSCKDDSPSKVKVSESHRLDLPELFHESTVEIANKVTKTAEEDNYINLLSSDDEKDLKKTNVETYLISSDDHIEDNEKDALSEIIFVNLEASAIHESEVDNTVENLGSRRVEHVGSVLEEAQLKLKAKSELKKHKTGKSPSIKKGTYTIVGIHIEVFRSNKSPLTKLTQIGCVVWGSEEKVFFRAVKPSGLEKYLDKYRLGGDLLSALHMTREDDGSFQFRKQFEIIKSDQKIYCVQEGEALTDFLNFIQKLRNCIIIGVDEDTIATLDKKLREVIKVKMKDKVKGFTYWKRFLKYLKVDDYKTLELEEFYTTSFAEELPSFISSKDIAQILLKSVIKLYFQDKGEVPHFYTLCKRAELLEKPKNVDFDRKAAVENVEVYSSFRHSVSTTISAEKLEQIALSSDSESESGFRSHSEVTNLVPLTIENIVPKSSKANFERNSSNLEMKDIETEEPSSKEISNSVRSLDVPYDPSRETFWQHPSPDNKKHVYCPLCRSVIKLGNIVLHFNSDHPDVSRFQLERDRYARWESIPCSPRIACCRRCELCKSQISVLDVVIHVLVTCPAACRSRIQKQQLMKYLCGICKKRFKTVGLLRSHVIVDYKHK